MRLFIIIYVLLIPFLSRSQSISPDGPSFGFIVWDSVKYVGTGFVIRIKRLVLTCAHVIDKNHKIYTASGGLKTPEIVIHKLKIVRALPQYDLAILESEADLCNRPFTVERSFNIKIRQHLFYLGYKVAASNLTQKSPFL
jgi:hypothetical protein